MDSSDEQQREHDDAQREQAAREQLIAEAQRAAEREEALLMLIQRCLCAANPERLPEPCDYLIEAADIMEGFHAATIHDHASIRELAALIYWTFQTSFSSTSNLTHGKAGMLAFEILREWKEMAL